MDYGEAIAHLHALGPELAPSATGTAPPRKFELAHMRRLAAELGNPQNRVPAVLIAGTNGKGSTAATLASILTAAGYRTGLYTSPHLVRVNERIQLAQPVLPSEYGVSDVHGTDGPLALFPIADEELARIYTLVEHAAARLVAAGELPHPPSFFERLTAIAFSFYANTDLLEARQEAHPALRPRADIVVLEVGLGGRLDATNIVEPLLSVITDIALDHQEYLGSTIAEIAGEKCGILRRNGILVTLSQHPQANQAIGEAAARLDVRGINAAAFLPPARRNLAKPSPESSPASSKAPHTPAIWRNQYALPTEEFGLISVNSPLAGEHQQRNLALALAAALTLRNNFGYTLDRAAVEKGIRETSWPARLEWITPHLLLDVAHNPAGAWTLRAAIGTLPEPQPRTLIFSCLRGKDLREMARILFPLFDASADGDPARRRDHIVLAPIPNSRAVPLDDLIAASQDLGIPARTAPDVAGALRLAQSLTPQDGVIVATGSIYLVGELRARALEPNEVLV